MRRTVICGPHEKHIHFLGFVIYILFLYSRYMYNVYNINAGIYRNTPSLRVRISITIRYSIIHETRV